MEQLFHSLHQACKKAGGITAVAQKIGVLERTLSKKVLPSNDVNMPNIGEFIRIMRATENTEPLEVLCGLFGGRFVSSNSDTADSVLQATLHAASESGDVIKAVEIVQKALSDGNLSHKDCLNIKREIMEAQSAFTVLKNTLDQVVFLKSVGE